MITELVNVVLIIMFKYVPDPVGGFWLFRVGNQL